MKKFVLLRDTEIWRERIYPFVEYVEPNLLNLCTRMTSHLVFQMFLYIFFYLLFKLTTKQFKVLEILLVLLFFKLCIGDLGQLA